MVCFFRVSRAFGCCVVGGVVGARALPLRGGLPCGFFSGFSRFASQVESGGLWLLGHTVLRLWLICRARAVFLPAWCPLLLLSGDSCRAVSACSLVILAFASLLDTLINPRLWSTHAFWATVRRLCCRSSCCLSVARVL